MLLFDGGAYFRDDSGVIRGGYDDVNPGLIWPAVGEVKWKLKRSTDKMHSKI